MNLCKASVFAVFAFTIATLTVTVLMGARPVPAVAIDATCLSGSSGVFAELIGLAL